MSTFMESTVDGMVKRITEAKNEAVKRGIEANVCVINEKYAYVEPFDIPTCHGTSKSPKRGWRGRCLTGKSRSYERKQMIKRKEVK